jgi:ATP-dependent RNA helicase RhlE
MISFEELDLIDPIKKALKTEGYTKPTPIQAQSIPLILAGNDLLGCAQTGTGKTAAFAIPIIQLLMKQTPVKGLRSIRTLIVTPTRELAIQIGESFGAYGKNTHLKYTVVFGGVGQKAQTDALQKGVDILVATPGRLLDLMNQRFITLKDINIFVLDEADRMLDMGFIHDVKKLIAALPAKRQSLFFSATMPPAIQKLSGDILKNPLKVEVTPESSTADTINQSVYMVDRDNKNSLLLHLIEDKNLQTVLVFTKTKHGADKVVKMLLHKNIKAAAIHGNKSQNARQRALDEFKTKKIRVLVATDIAARGIDIDELAHVINYEIPNIPETYVHRIGRTGRAGSNGTAYSFCEIDEKEFLQDIQKIIGKTIPKVDDHPFPMTKFTASPSNKKGKRPAGSVGNNRVKNSGNGKSFNNRRPKSENGEKKHGEERPYNKRPDRNFKK